MAPHPKTPSKVYITSSTEPNSIFRDIWLEKLQLSKPGYFIPTPNTSNYDSILERFYRKGSSEEQK